MRDIDHSIAAQSIEMHVYMDANSIPITPVHSLDVLLFGTIVCRLGRLEVISGKLGPSWTNLDDLH